MKLTACASLTMHFDNIWYWLPHTVCTLSLRTAVKSAVSAPNMPNIDTHSFDIEGSPAFKLIKLANLVTQEFEREIAIQLDVSLVEWRVIAAVYGRTGVTAAEVANIIGHNVMVVSRAVNRLVSDARLSRMKDDNDSRCLILKLTDKGRDLFQQISPMALRVEESLFGTAVPQEIIAINRFLETGLRARGRGQQATGRAFPTNNASLGKSLEK